MHLEVEASSCEDGTRMRAVVMDELVARKAFDADSERPCLEAVAEGGKDWVMAHVAAVIWRCLVAASYADSEADRGQVSESALEAAAPARIPSGVVLVDGHVLLYRDCIDADLEEMRHWCCRYRRSCSCEKRDGCYFPKNASDKHEAAPFAEIPLAYIIRYI